MVGRADATGPLDEANWGDSGRATEGETVEVEPDPVTGSFDGERGCADPGVDSPESADSATCQYNAIQ